MRFTSSILILTLLSPPAFAASSKPARKPAAAQASHLAAYFKALKDYEGKNDDLALRILIKRIARYPLTFHEWLRVREVLHRRPGIGYSLLFKWDNVPFKDTRSNHTKLYEEKVNAWLRLADDKMSAGQFENAFTMYQKAANTLKKEFAVKHWDNYLLFQTTLHSMARALYGAMRFDDALTVYSWISKNYPRYRQVLFERMWAAFRGNHADLALGAVASQQSAFFSNFMEPESYLVQIYLYKKLCRDDDLKAVRQSMLTFRDNLKDGHYTYADWARSDLENYSLYRLTRQPASDDGPVTAAEKKKEQNLIKTALETKFESEKHRLLQELNQVLAYSYLAVGADVLHLQGAGELDRSRIRKSGQEYWPADDSEDWLDEIGNHVYIGSSKCVAKK